MRCTPSDPIRWESENRTASDLLRELELVFEHPQRTSSGQPVSSLFRGPGRLGLRCAAVAEFVIEDRRISSQELENGSPTLTELNLLGTVLALRLEQMGVLALHGSSVATSSGAVVFLGSRGSGKSTFATAMLRRGARLLSDDLVATASGCDDWLIRPAFPQMRMEPDTARWYLGSTAGLERAHPLGTKLAVPISTFEPTPQPLRAIVILSPNPDGGPMSVGAAGRSDALIELLRHSFAPRMCEAAGLHTHRLAHLTLLARGVSFHRARYRPGLESLDDAADRLFALL